MEANCQIKFCRVPGPACRGRKLSALSVALCMLLGMIGCGGPKLVEAGGTVKYNNQSITGADVVFVPDEGGSPVIGRTDEQGKFSLSTDGKSGALPGPYKIAITAIRQKRAVKDSEAVGMTDAQIASNHETLIPKKYNNTMLSGLTAKVSEDRSVNVFSLDLK